MHSGICKEALYILSVCVKVCKLALPAHLAAHQGYFFFFCFPQLNILYRRVENIDLFTGAVLEKPLPGGVLGPTFACILGIQFRRLREGDRFWYETPDQSIGFNDHQLAEIRKASLARVICDNNNNINLIQPKVMQRANRYYNRLTSCDFLPAINLTKWEVDK